MVNIRTFDLNLLLALKALVEEKSVSLAAKKLCISQPAMSHVLRKLRSQLDDPILVKLSSGMIPTARACPAGSDGCGPPGDRKERPASSRV